MAIIGRHPRITTVQLRLENGAPGRGWGLQDKKNNSRQPLRQVAGLKASLPPFLCPSPSALWSQHWLREEGQSPSLGSRAKAELCSGRANPIKHSNHHLFILKIKKKKVFSDYS